MQQAYRILRVVAEAQTIRMVLLPNPGKLMLQEFSTACTALAQENSKGIKAIVLDFKEAVDARDTDKQAASEDDVRQAVSAVHNLQPPVLAVVRDTVSATASVLVQTADLTLVAHHAGLIMQQDTDEHQNETRTGAEALRLGLVSWSVPAQAIDAELRRVLEMLREKSAVALRLTKASMRVGTTHSEHPPDGEEAATATRLAALKQINEFYLAHVMQTADATEGLQAFLEKRQPRWKNE